MSDQQIQQRPSGRQPGACWCGCGGSTRARFVPGHDAVFHSLAKRVARGQASMPDSFVNVDAKGDFMKHHDAEKAKVEANAAGEPAKAPLKAESSSTNTVGASAASPGGYKSPPSGLTSRTGLRRALLGDFPAGKTLCIGIDFAWWGGGKSPLSQTDTLVFAHLNGEHGSSLKLERVDLHETYNRNADDTEPNCDPDAELVLQKVRDVVESDAGESRIVLAVDAPLRAVDRPHLPARSRKADKMTMSGQKGGNRLEYRQCDRAALKGFGLDDVSGWRHVWNVQPGAPLCPRVAALVKGLHDLGFQLYTDPATDVRSRLLFFECFPGEALWYLGMKGTFAPYRAGEANRYKVEKLRNPRLWGLPPREAWRPWPTVLSWVFRSLYGFSHPDVLGVGSKVFAGWMAGLTHALLTDHLLMDASGRLARRGKQLDDMVESVNCFLTAVSFARNRAHVWIGDEPADGHIIGPGTDGSK